MILFVTQLCVYLYNFRGIQGPWHQKVMFSRSLAAQVKCTWECPLINFYLFFQIQSHPRQKSGQRKMMTMITQTRKRWAWTVFWPTVSSMLLCKSLEPTLTFFSLTCLLKARATRKHPKKSFECSSGSLKNYSCRLLKETTRKLA